MKLIQLISVAACAVVPAAQVSAREAPKRVTTSCIGDRCAVYVNGRRTASVTTERRQYTIRDRNGNLIARVRPDR